MILGLEPADLEARYPQPAIIDCEVQDPNGEWVWAGQFVYQIFHKYSPMGDPIASASAEWCKEKGIVMIDDD